VGELEEESGKPGQRRRRLRKGGGRAERDLERGY
jgi:hypothetical protein